ncbi:hypothetical protein [Plantactinospora sp. CA-290183]|uniref:hypothetical protein n=1 Tax=Plantactinospora sp. CA-290183 TaxID=3240006 RepID=UPI003D8DA2C4
MTITCTNLSWDLTTLLGPLRDQALRPVGPPGGPDWTTQKQTLFLSSLEACWPTGTLLLWAASPSAGERWRVLDGHRRLAVLTALEGGTRTITRDLTIDEATDPAAYVLPPTGGPRGRYLPTSAMLHTMPFLFATRDLDATLRRRAEEFSAKLMRARIRMTLLTGGTPDEIRACCARLLPHRVHPAVLSTLHRKQADSGPDQTTTARDSDTPPRPRHGRRATTTDQG